MKQVGRELGVRYVLEGSVRKAANRVRITGQLIDVSNGAHLWADRFDGGIEEYLRPAGSGNYSVVGAICAKTEQAEIARARRKRSDSLDAYDLYLRALPYVHANLSRRDKVCSAAVGTGARHRPQLCDCARLRCLVPEQDVHAWQPATPMDRGFALRHGRAALARERDDSSALGDCGFIVAMLDRDFAAAFECSRSVDRAQRQLRPYGVSAMVRAMHDDYDRAIEHAERALRLSPFDPLREHPKWPWRSHITTAAI